MRPIDADDLLEIIEKYCSDYDCHDSESFDKQAVRMAIRSAPTLTPPNEPLTLEDLLRMGGAPVWLDVAGGMWALVDALDGCLWLDRGGSIDIAKFAGKAYRSRPPEGEEDTDV